MAATHRLGGLASGAVLAIAVSKKPEEALIITGLSIFGSILPDIDNGNSAISWKMPVTSLIVRIGQCIVRGISHLLPKKIGDIIRCGIGHRGFTHSLLGIAMFYALSLMIAQSSGISISSQLIALSISIGIASHIILDMLAGGTPLLLPITKKRITLAKIKTGGITEWIFRMIFMMIMLYAAATIAPPYIEEIILKYGKHLGQYLHSFF